jgi:hypothetical protein
MLKKSLFFAWLLVAACAPRTSEDPELLAELGGEKLYKEDLRDRLPAAGSMEPADSAGYVDLLIHSWAKNILLVQAAEFNLKTELQDFEALVKQYRNDLLKHAYIDRYVSQHLDTNIREEEIQAYYQENLENFELKESIIKANYMAAPVSAQKIDQAKQWFKGEKSAGKFLDWAEVFATKQSNYSDSLWIPMDDFLKEIPLESNNPYVYLNRNSKFTCEDTTLVYFVEVKALRFEDTHSPLEYVSERIRKVLLNKRRIELISRIEENIIDDAIEEGTLTIY